MLDIRIPIGLMFLVIGPLLMIYGVVSDPKMYEVHSLGININLWWGLALLVFGCGMLGLAWYARLTGKPRGPA